MAEWDIDLQEVNGLRSWYRKSPGLVRVASAMLLNNFAFGTRDESIHRIAALMTVRNPRFVASRIRVTKTSTSTPIAQQRSITGSVAAPRFSGWVEQETGAATLRHRYATLAGRAGDEKKQIRPSVRLKPSNEVITPADYNPRGGPGNIGGFFAMALRKKEARLLKIKGKIYKRNRNKIDHVQTLKTKQPREQHWLRQARAIYFRKNPPQATWNRTASRLMKPPPKR